MVCFYSKTYLHVNVAFEEQQQDPIIRHDPCVVWAAGVYRVAALVFMSDRAGVFRKTAPTFAPIATEAFAGGAIAVRHEAVYQSSQKGFVFARPLSADVSVDVSGICRCFLVADTQDDVSVGESSLLEFNNTHHVHLHRGM